MKWIARILVVLVLLALVPVFFGNRLITRFVMQGIEEQTGFKVAVDDIQVSLFRPVVKVSNLVLSNPPEYPHPEALEVREAYVSFNWLSLLGREIKLKELRLDVPRIVMVRPEQGGSNIEELMRTGQKKEEAKPSPPDRPPPTTPDAPAPSEPAKTKPPKTLAIDRLTVNFGEMEVRQYSPKRGEPTVLTIPVGLNRTYENVTNINDVATQLSTELIVRSGVGLVGNLDALRDVISGESDKMDPQLKEQIKDLKNLFRRKPE